MFKMQLFVEVNTAFSSKTRPQVVIILSSLIVVNFIDIILAADHPGIVSGYRFQGFKDD